MMRKGKKERGRYIPKRKVQQWGWCMSLVVVCCVVVVESRSKKDRKKDIKKKKILGANLRVIGLSTLTLEFFRKARKYEMTE